MNRTRIIFLMVMALSWALLTPFAYAQRGMGDSTGVARQGIVPEFVTVSCELLSVETHPCKKTTGCGVIGTHLKVKTREGKVLNIDLGWAIGVELIVKQLSIGQHLEVTAFRTEKMPEGQYVAKSLNFDGKTVPLRDESLRPIWAGGRAAWEGPPERGGYGRGRGWGRGRGAGWNAAYCPRYDWR
jgi:hypothetical protein